MGSEGIQDFREVTKNASDNLQEESFNKEFVSKVQRSLAIKEEREKEVNYAASAEETEDLTIAVSEKELQSITYDLNEAEMVAKRIIEGLVEDEVEEAELEEEEEVNKLFVNEEFPIPTPESMTDNEFESVTEDVQLDDSGAAVTVKLRTNTDETMTSTFNINTNIKEVKERLANIFKVKVGDIRLDYQGEECYDLLSLYGLGAEPLGTLELGIQSTDPERILAPGTFSRYIPVVDVITVRVTTDDGCIKYIVVEIENQNFTKQWLGGYRHRITKIEYHHAAVQTLPRKRPKDSLPQFSAETQTPVFPLKDTGIDTTLTKATQMWRTDRFIPSVNDKILRTDPNRFRGCSHISFQTLVLLVNRIKTFYKHFKYRQQLKKDMRNKALQSQMDREQLKQRKEMLKDINKKMIVGTTFPLKRDDFFMLYLMVGKWWAKQIARVKTFKDNECRKAALLEVLEKEIELLWAIEKQRVIAKKEILLKQDMTMLEIQARPIIFRNNKGIMSSIDTLETQLAREYQEIMSSYLNTNVTKEARIDVLTTLKYLLRSFGAYEYMEEIVKLLERECDLLVLGMKDDHLKPLRDRVQQLLSFYIQQYLVHPIGKIKKPGLPKTDDSLYRCDYCSKLKPASDYNVHVKMTKFNQCYSCEWIKNIGHQRYDLTPFAKMLKRVRQSEIENCCYSSICFVLQVVGMQYLTSTIWRCMSALSKVTDMSNLRMVRFRKHEDWSPWNCILLTFEESLLHLSVEDVNSFYSASFLERIHWKHMRARNHFLPLFLNDKHLVDSKLWFNIRDSGKFLHPSHINKFAKQEDFEYIKS